MLTFSAKISSQYLIKSLMSMCGVSKVNSDRSVDRLFIWIYHCIDYLVQLFSREVLKNVIKSNSQQEAKWYGDFSIDKSAEIWSQIQNILIGRNTTGSSDAEAWFWMLRKINASCVLWHFQTVIDFMLLANTKSKDNKCKTLLQSKLVLMEENQITLSPIFSENWNSKRENNQKNGIF